MPGRSDELDSEPGEIEDDRVQDVHFHLAPVAASGADLAELEGSAEQAQGLTIEGPCQVHGVAIDEEVLPDTDGHPMIVREPDRPRGTRTLALHAEQAPAGVERQPTADCEQRPCRAGIPTGAARLRTPSSVKDGLAAVSPRHGRHALRKSERAMPLSEPFEKGPQHRLVLITGRVRSRRD